MPPFNIVEADLNDSRHARAVVALLEGYAREPGGGGVSLSDETRERLIPELRKLSNVLVLLAVVEEDPVGVAVCFQGFSTFAAKPLLNVHDLTVHPDFRGQGIGRRLLEEAERRARERGCCKVTLEALASNAGARKLYRTLGFQGDEASRDASFFLTKKL